MLRSHLAASSIDRPVYLLIDEIQTIPDWPRWVREVAEYDAIRTIATGSTNPLADPKEATLLTGRMTERTLWPMSLSERVRHRHPKAQTTSALVQEELTCMLEDGSMPVTIDMLESDRLATLDEMFRLIVRNDVPARPGTLASEDVTRLALELLTQTANLQSYKRLNDTLGWKNGRAKNACAAVESVHLVHRVVTFDAKSSAIERGDFKVYATDVGVRNAVAHRVAPDRGRLLETVVAGELRRRLGPGHRLFRWQGARECDFLVVRGDAPISALQVTMEVSALAERELDGLVECLEHFDLVSGVLVTWNLDEIRTIRGRTVRLVPARDWLMRQMADPLP